MIKAGKKIVFDQATLNQYRILLQKYQVGKPSKLKEAAVLIPLCTVRNEPSVLFTVRSSNLREHSGEVSFPGGKRDPVDIDLAHTALRETHEEINIPTDKIDIIGRFIGMPNKAGTTLVASFVGFLGEVDPLSIKKNDDEVEYVFAVSIEQLLKTREIEDFRALGVKIPAWTVGEYRIWGLTGYILGTFLTKIVEPTRDSKL